MDVGVGVYEDVPIAPRLHLPYHFQDMHVLILIQYPGCELGVVPRMHHALQLPQISLLRPELFLKEVEVEIWVVGCGGWGDGGQGVVKCVRREEVGLGEV